MLRKSTVNASPPNDRARMTGLPYARHFLRRATRTEHAAAEGTAVMRALFEEDLGIAAYLRLLQGYYALYASWERAHAGWLRDDLKRAGWSYRTRLPAIESDLREWGAQPDTPNYPAAVEGSASGDQVSWGSLYVIEGSVLGGPFIAKKLATEFSDHPHRFFCMSHRANGASWKDFSTVIAGQLMDSTSRRTIAIQAKACFRSFQHMLDGVMG